MADLEKLAIKVTGTVHRDGQKVVYQRTAKGLGNITVPGRHDLQRRKHVIPTDYRTESQIRCRARIAAATAAWHELGDAQRRDWDRKSGKKPISGFNLFVRDFCRIHPLTEF